jgi:hypothetical protein
MKRPRHWSCLGWNAGRPNQESWAKRRYWIGWDLLPALFLGVAVLAGCTKKTTLTPNLPPETTVFVQGDLDTVSYRVHLYWFGSDPDGFISGYELRFIFPGENPDTVGWDLTPKSDSLFSIYTPSGFSMPRFEVRAIDDQGRKDETPAVQEFRFRNEAPIVRLLGMPPVPDTTFASVTISWSASDIDGELGGMTFRTWLSGNEAAAHVLPAGTTTFTFPSDDFRAANGMFVSGPDTLFVQAIDDGGRAGAPASYTWFVKAPTTGSEARLLLIDDVQNALVDSLYVNGVARAIPGDLYTVLDLQRSNPFRSAKDVEQTFKLFDAVMWYRETNLGFSTLLQMAQPGFEAYLRTGGNFYLNGLNLIAGERANGPLTPSFVTEFLGSDGFIKALVSGRTDSTAAWTLEVRDTLNSDVYQDSLSSTQIYNGMRGFLVRDPSWIAFYARPGMITPGHPYPLPVAVRVPQSSGGKALVFTFPLRGADGFRSAPRVLQKVLADLGVVPAGPLSLELLRSRR